MWASSHRDVCSRKIYHISQATIEVLATIKTVWPWNSLLGRRPGLLWQGRNRIHQENWHDGTMSVSSCDNNYPQSLPFAYRCQKLTWSNSAIKEWRSMTHKISHSKSHMHNPLFNPDPQEEILINSPGLAVYIYVNGVWCNYKIHWYWSFVMGVFTKYDYIIFSLLSLTRGKNIFAANQQRSPHPTRPRQQGKARHCAHYQNQST